MKINSNVLIGVFGLVFYCLSQFLIGKYLHHTGLGLLLAFISTMITCVVVMILIAVRSNKSSRYERTEL